jgi:predicted nucleotidyltransferase
MSIYRINYEQLRQEPLISGMLIALEDGFNRYGIDFYLVGATARDAWISGIHFKRPGRATKDVDFAVLINAKGQYEALKDYYIREKGFLPSKENAFVLFYKDKMQVDLLPFGAVEDENHMVTIEGTGYTRVHVPGFAEIYSSGLPEMELAGKHRFKCCTLPGIVILKLLAWHDRPESRRGDILDISDILHHFFSIYDNEIWENHSDLFDNEEADLLHIAARVMGREIRKIVVQNEELLKGIENILANDIADESKSRIGSVMTAYFNNTVQDNVVLLKALKEGILD